MDTDTTKPLQGVKEDRYKVNGAKMVEILGEISGENMRYSDDDVVNELRLKNDMVKEDVLESAKEKSKRKVYYMGFQCRDKCLSCGLSYVMQREVLRN